MTLRPFVGTDDLAAVLGQTVDDTDLITAIALDAGCEAVRSYIGQMVNYVQDDTEYIDGRGRVKIRLRERPIRDLTSVTLDGDEVDTALYNRKASTLRKLDGVGWPMGFANIVVTYSHGWDIIPDDSAGDDLLVPADLRLVALLSAKRVYLTVGTTQGEVVSETIGGYSYTIGGAAIVQSASELLAPEQMVLERYRIGEIPGR